MRLVFIIGILFILLAVGLAAETADECAAKYDDCAKKCNDECNQKKYTYCRTYEYSGCALDVFCACNICDIYSGKWCVNDGWMALSSGPYEWYVNCIEGCQTSMESGEDVSTCWADCNAGLNERLQEAKNQVCDDYCRDNDYENGTWSNFNDGVWDTCFCQGDLIEENLDEDLFPDSNDWDGDGVPNNLDWCPEEEGSSRAYGCPDEDSDGVPDFADQCNGETGTWEYAGCAKTLMDDFAETPYQFADWIKYIFSPQGEEVKGLKKVGFIKAVKDKNGIRIWRPSAKKWLRVGVHMSIFEGDRLRTGPDSKAKVIIFNDFQNAQDVFDIRSNTLYEVPGSANYYKGERPIVFWIKGAVKTAHRRLTGQKPNFYVKTPTISTGARGTEYIVEHDPDTLIDTVLVLEGEVEVSGNTTEILTRGQRIIVERGTLGEVETVSQESIEAALSEYEDYDLYISPWVWVLLAVVIIAAGGWFILRKKRVH